MQRANKQIFGDMEMERNGEGKCNHNVLDCEDLVLALWGRIVV